MTVACLLVMAVVMIGIVSSAVAVVLMTAEMADVVVSCIWLMSASLVA